MTGKTALLMIDIQQAMFGPDEICHQPEHVLANAGELLARARVAGTPVYFVQHCEAEGGFAPKSAGWQIHSKVAPRASEPVTEKWAASSFYKTDLDQKLRAAGFDTLVIAGLQSEFCIDRLPCGTDPRRIANTRWRWAARPHPRTMYPRCDD